MKGISFSFYVEKIGSFGVNLEGDIMGMPLGSITERMSKLMMNCFCSINRLWT